MKEISLRFMTKKLCHQFFREHESDPATCPDESEFLPYVYSEETADRFYERKQVPGRLELVAMMDGHTIGHVQLKNIDKEKRECELGFHMQNDSVKNLGYGTQAEPAGPGLCFCKPGCGRGVRVYNSAEHPQSACP